MEDMPDDPEFIRYLLSPDTNHDTYVNVGRGGITETIGVIKKMLGAHSDYFKGVLKAPDINKLDMFPNAFKNLLKYVYGYNNVSNWTYEECLDVYCTSYTISIPDLYNQLTEKLVELLSSSNIFMALNKVAYIYGERVSAKIYEIIQHETRDIIRHPSFSSLSFDAVFLIVTQKVLSVPEAMVYKAAISWIKTGKCNSLESARLLKSIRIRTISFQEICLNFPPSEFLSIRNFIRMSQAFGKQETFPCITGFSDSTVVRGLSIHEVLNNEKLEMKYLNETTLTLETSHCIKLLPFMIQAREEGDPSENYRCVCTIRIHPQYDAKQPIIINFNQFVNYGQPFSIPIKKDGLLVTIKKAVKYVITINFEDAHPAYLSRCRLENETIKCFESDKKQGTFSDGSFFHFISFDYISVRR